MNFLEALVDGFAPNLMHGLVINRLRQSFFQSVQEFRCYTGQISPFHVEESLLHSDQWRTRPNWWRHQRARQTRNSRRRPCVHCRRSCRSHPETLTRSSHCRSAQCTRRLTTSSAWQRTQSHMDHTAVYGHVIPGSDVGRNQVRNDRRHTHSDWRT